ncbi:MarR family transcriptional regulator [Nocardioides sp. T2.26MG-1]|uniref:MarR family transcriptional regulator n=1 Tax=Nocardioides sp. T2.26MG-1 TaxID=3041166 RepID=UPI002477A50C|nr:MarR family transcriptional regulator [Nocardioides sp. T2.26MG-1]CAI9416373.1 hypothetical protein HIDPHFAB_02756 [Nocardioides sp. T2.26MG-1]
MPTPFGPQLIGETEKTLNALLNALLAGRLSEPEWVTLRLAHLLEGEVGSADQLAAAVSDRARFDDAAELVRGLTAAGLLQDGRPTAQSRALVADLQEQIAVRIEPIWRDLPAEDLAAAARVLTHVRDRARAGLASL